MNREGLALVPESELVDEIRALMPRRTVSHAEARSIAERQATLLLDLSSITEPPVPQFVIASLPGIVVDYQEGWPTSGMCVQAQSHWRIVIRAEEPRWRQRFSLAHEFKHVLDDPVIERLSAHLSPEQRDIRAEGLCNYFAACLLMPRGWVKTDWASGIQNVWTLARRYYVSEIAMTTRLSELGLRPSLIRLDSAPRHRTAA